MAGVIALFPRVVGSANSTNMSQCWHCWQFVRALLTRAAVAFLQSSILYSVTKSFHPSAFPTMAPLCCQMPVVFLSLALIVTWNKKTDEHFILLLQLSKQNNLWDPDLLYQESYNISFFGLHLSQVLILELEQLKCRWDLVRKVLES